MPFISICVPAYKNPDYLKRLLDSISLQSFKDFEIIITDDSPDNSLAQIINEYASLYTIIYKKNAVALGSPKNWNSSISMASGKWIKIMHDDDWFTNENSLNIFAEAANNNENIDFIFSGYDEINIESGKKNTYIINDYEKSLLQKSPYNLLKKNFIGHPSTTLIKNQQTHWFNTQLKWVVDFEFYIRVLQSNKIFYAITQPLITIGLSDLQITKQVFRDASVEVPENLFLLESNSDILKNFFAYDYFWRFIRNLSIRNLQDLKKYIKPGTIISKKLQNLISFQAKFPKGLLKNGIVSKMLMSLSYFFN